MFKILTNEQSKNIAKISILSSNPDYIVDINDILETDRLYLVIIKVCGKNNPGVNNGELILILEKYKQTTQLFKITNDSECLLKTGNKIGMMRVDTPFDLRENYASMTKIEIDDPYKRRGYGTEAMHNYYKYFFTKYPTYTIEHIISETNTKSIKFHEKFQCFDKYPSNLKALSFQTNKELFLKDIPFKSREERISSYLPKDTEYQKYIQSKNNKEDSNKSSTVILKYENSSTQESICKK